MRTLIIEPHPDDAVLSLYGLISTYLKELGGVYLMSVADNGANSSEFCVKAGITYVDNGMMDDVNFNLHKMNWRDIVKAPNPWLIQRGYYLDQFPLQYQQVCDLIGKVMPIIDPDVIVVPIGIYHPMHILVSEAADKAAGRAMMLWYADTPYQFKGYGRITIDSFLVNGNGHEVVKAWTGKEADIKAKLSMFRKCYKGQSVHWDEPSFYRSSEMIFAEGARL